MPGKNGGAVPVGEGAASQLNVARERTSRAGARPTVTTKWLRVLAAFQRGERLTRFDAERLYADHVLPSTVSELMSKGVVIARENVTLPGYRGERVTCARYWLEDGSRTRAAELLARHTEMRGTA